MGIELVQCTLRLPADLVRKAKRLAFEESKPFQAWVRELIEEALEKTYSEVLEKVYTKEVEAPLISGRPKAYRRKSEKLQTEEPLGREEIRSLIMEAVQEALKGLKRRKKRES